MTVRNWWLIFCKFCSLDRKCMSFFILIGPTWIAGPPLVTGDEINPVQPMWTENGQGVLLQRERMGSVTIGEGW